METENYDYYFKVLLLGDLNVGVRSIFFRYVDNTFNESNIGIDTSVDFKIKTFKLDGDTYKLQIILDNDRGRGRTLDSTLYTSAHGVIVVYDITNQASFDHVKDWLTDIERYSKSEAARLMVGNKCDLSNKRSIISKDAEEFCKGSQDSVFGDKCEKFCQHRVSFSNNSKRNQTKNSQQKDSIKFK